MSSPEIATAATPTSSVTAHHGLEEQTDPVPAAPHHDRALSKGEGDDAVPENRAESIYERVEDDWQHDPRNPRNWSSKKKWTAATIVSFYTFVSPLASSMMAPALPQIADSLGITNPTIISLTLSIFLLSYALGPLILSPLSEMYGRIWVLHISNIFFLGFNLGCAYAKNPTTMIVLRLLAGFAGSAPVGIGGGCISDMFSERDRAGAMAAYTLGPLIGPAVGPIAGGFVAETIGWQWIFKIIACACGVASLVGIPFLREMYAPVIRLRIAKKSGDTELAEKRHPHFQKEHGNKWHVLYVNLTRPFVLLAKSLICLLLSVYMGVSYGIYYLMFATFPDLFENTYGFSPGIAGLAYIGLGLGFCLATFFGGQMLDYIYRKESAKNGGKGKPEFRLPLLIIGSFIIPIGLFWYGWSAQAKLHYMMPIVGTGIFGFGLMATFLPIQLYLVDSFVYAASAMAAASVVRSLFGFVFPLFAEQMFAALGNGPGNSLLAGLSIVFGIPFPIFLYFHGENLRSRSNLTRSPS